MMEVKITRNRNGHGMLHCTRPDGSATWLPLSPFFVLHDLCHYAVETTLGFTKAFYGMLAAGTDIRQFELPKEQRPFELSPEALQAEQIVNLLVIEYAQGRMDDLLDQLAAVNELNASRQEPAVLDIAQLELIRERFNALAEKWQALPENESLVLNFMI